LGVPLIARSQVIGAMAIQSFTSFAFDEEHQRLLLSLASLVAISLKNAELFSETSRWLHKLQGLHDIDEAITTQDDIKIIFEVILQRVMSQLNVDAAEILTWDPNLNILHHSARKGFYIRLSTASFTHLDDRLDYKRMLERGIVAIPDVRKVGPGGPHIPPAPGEDFVAYFAVPLIAKGELQGILETYFRHPMNPDSEWLDFLETLAGQAAIAINNATLVKNLQNKNLELSLAYDKTLEGWSQALDMRDMETEGHSQRVTELSILLASELGVPKDEIIHIRRGALLHDIGKIGIPDNILHKPSTLTPDEQQIMHRHPELAYQLLSTIPYLHPALAIPYCHHEKWDGSGYPRHLKGEEIPLQARIFSVVDVWDALRSNRLYRSAWSEDKTLDYIAVETGKSFDPKVVEVFFRLIRRRMADNQPA
jgi:HD-GYP domain-containing protein (c-di-GMP phosphodiesterase class II)